MSLSRVDVRGAQSPSRHRHARQRSSISSLYSTDARMFRAPRIVCRYVADIASLARLSTLIARRAQTRSPIGVNAAGDEGTHPRQYLASRGRNVLYPPPKKNCYQIGDRNDACTVQTAFAVQARHRDSPRERDSLYFDEL